MYEFPSDLQELTFEEVASGLMIGFQDRKRLLSGYYGNFSDSPNFNLGIADGYCMVDNLMSSAKGEFYESRISYPSGMMQFEYYYTRTYDHIPTLTTRTLDVQYIDYNFLTWACRMFTWSILRTFSTPSTASGTSLPYLHVYSYEDWWREFFPDEPSICSGLMNANDDGYGIDLYDFRYPLEIARALDKATSGIIYYYNNEDDYGWHAQQCTPNWILSN